MNLNIDFVPEDLRARLLAGETVTWAVDGERCPECPEPGLQWDPRVMGNVVACRGCNGSTLVAPAPFRDLDKPCPTCGGDGQTDDVGQPSFPRCPDCHDGRLVVDIVGPCPHLVPCWCPPAVRLARATVRCHGPVEDDSWRSVEPLPLPGQWVVYVEPMMEGS
jgi:hypothetical protein